MRGAWGRRQHPAPLPSCRTRTHQECVREAGRHGALAHAASGPRARARQPPCGAAPPCRPAGCWGTRQAPTPPHLRADGCHEHQGGHQDREPRAAARPTRHAGTAKVCPACVAGRIKVSAGGTSAASACSAADSSPPCVCPGAAPRRKPPGIEKGYLYQIVVGAIATPALPPAEAHRPLIAQQQQQQQQQHQHQQEGT
jgi:hypothetical protein